MMRRIALQFSRSTLVGGALLGSVWGQSLAGESVCGAPLRFEAQSVRFESYHIQSRLVGIPEFDYEGTHIRYFRKRHISGEGEVYDLSGNRIFEGYAPIFEYEKADTGTFMQVYSWRCEVEYDLAGNRTGTLLNRSNARYYKNKEGTAGSSTAGFWQYDPEDDVSYQYEWVADVVSRTPTLVEVRSRAGETWPNIHPVSAPSLMRDELSEEDTLQDAFDNADIRGANAERTGSENRTFPVSRNGRWVSAQTSDYTALFYLDEPSGPEESCPVRAFDYPVYAEFESRAVESSDPWVSLGPAQKVDQIVYRRNTPMPYEVQGSIPVREGKEVRLKSIWVERESDCGSSGGGKEYRSLASAQWGLTLDRLDPEEPFARLEFYAPTLEPGVFHPRSLVLRNEEQVAGVVRETDGTLRQILLPQSVIHIEVLDDSAFEVAWHSLAVAVSPGDPVPDPDTWGDPVSRHRIQEGEAGGLEIIKFAPEEVSRTRFTEDAETGRWTVHVSPGDFIEHLDREESSGQIVETRTVELGMGNTIRKTQRIYRTDLGADVGGRKLVARIEDPDELSGKSHRGDFSYIQNEASAAFGRLQHMIRSDGYWERYGYDGDGRLARRVSGYRGNAFTTADAENREVEWVRGLLPDMDGDGEPEELQTVVETLRGLEVKRTFTLTYSDDSDGLVRETRKALTPGAAWDDGSNRNTRRTYDGRGRLLAVRRPDGTGERNFYTKTGGEWITDSQRGGFDPVGGVSIVAGERTVSRTNRSGHAVERTVTDLETGLTVEMEVNAEADRDYLGRPLRMDFMDGTFWERVYACCGLVYERDRRGQSTDYFYDALDRRIGQTRDGMTLLQLRSYDEEAGALVLESMRYGWGGQSMRVSLEVRNLLGEVIAREDARGRRTVQTRTWPAPGVIEERTVHPDGSDSIIRQAADGAMLARQGLAEYPMRFEEEGVSVTLGGNTFPARLNREISLDAAGAPYAWTETLRDMMGQVVAVRRGGIGLTDAVERHVYNGKGQRIQSTDPDGVTTLVEYDVEGSPVIQAVDMNDNGVIDPDGPDRIIETRTFIVEDPEKGRVRRTERRVAAETGSSIRELISRTDQSLFSLTRWDSSYGLERKTEVFLMGDGIWSQMVTGADGVQTEEQYDHDRLLTRRTTNPVGEVLQDQQYRYDGYNRLAEVEDEMAGTSSADYFADDRVSSIREPDPEGGAPWVTTYFYDARGREESVLQPDGSRLEMRYTLRGELKQRWGGREYPVEYAYDNQGRMVQLTTWKEWDPAAGEGIAGGVTTAWIHDARGHLLEKQYDVRPDGSFTPGPAYTYTPGGRLLQRHWARGVSTSYTYNPAGDLIRTHYSDNTPEINLVTNRQGQLIQVADAAGVRE
ncbi:MAG: hypothetical protein WD490_06330, partial [Opitutales bacterium]